jgi:hypothetical protein
MKELIGFERSIQTARSLGCHKPISMLRASRVNDLPIRTCNGVQKHAKANVRASTASVVQTDTISGNSPEVLSLAGT